MAGVQIRNRMVMVIFNELCLGLLWFLKVNSCTSYVLSWLGFLPMQVIFKFSTLNHNI